MIHHLRLYELSRVLGQIYGSSKTANSLLMRMKRYWKKCMTIVTCVDFEEEGDLNIWEQENEINSHNPDQY